MRKDAVTSDFVSDLFTQVFEVQDLGSYRVEWSGVEWSGVEWSGVEWSGVEWSGVEWSGVESSSHKTDGNSQRRYE